MHFKNARNASVYAVFRAFFTQSLAKLRILKDEILCNVRKALFFYAVCYIWLYRNFYKCRNRHLIEWYYSHGSVKY